MTKFSVTEFELHAARAFFASAWADMADETNNSHQVSNGVEIMDAMPDDIDPAAVHAARTLRMDMERLNARPIVQMMREIKDNTDPQTDKGDRPATMEYFGHYAAMQAMGHGVGLADAFGSDIRKSIKVPYIEFGSHSLHKDYFA